MEIKITSKWLAALLAILLFIVASDVVLTRLGL